MFGMGSFERKTMLTAFHWGVPGVPVYTPIQLKVYPNFMVRGDSLDLDPASILAGTGAVFDRGAYDYIRDQPFLRKMSESMRQLEDSGRLEFVSYADHIAEFAGTLNAWLDEVLAEHPERWRHAIIAQLSLQAPLTREQAPIIGKTLDLVVEGYPSGLIAHLALIGDKIDFVEAERVMRLARSGRRKFTRGEAAVLGEVARPFLAQAGTDLLLSERLGATLTPWEDQRAFHEGMAASKASPLTLPDIDRKLNEECLRLFREVIPQMRLEEAREIIAFQSDRKAVRSLVAALRESITGRHPLTLDQIFKDFRTAHYKHARAELADRKIKVASVGTKIVLAGVSGGVAPAALEALGEHAIGLIEKGAEALALVAEEAIVPRERKHRWLSRLSKIEGDRDRRVARAARRRRIADRVRRWLGRSPRAA